MKALFIRGCILGTLLLLSLCPVNADELLSFVLKPWQQVTNEYRTRPLNGISAAECAILKVMEVINDICMTNALVLMSTTNDGTPLAHPGGVILSAPYLDSLRREFDADYHRAL